MSWFEAFKRQVSTADFFARFIPNFVRDRERSYTCSFHDEKTPSLNVDPLNGTFHCFGCGAEGGILKFFALTNKYNLDDPDQHQRCIAALLAAFGVQAESVTEVPELIDDTTEPLSDDQLRVAIAAARERIAAAPGVPASAQPDPIDQTVVDDLAKALWSLEGDYARSYLVKERGLTEATLRQFQIGWSAPEPRRIAFPVFDEAGHCVNIRFYSPKKKGKKFLPFKEGYGKPRLYPVQQLVDVESVILAEGEMDTLTLNQNGFPSVTTTGGAKLDWGRTRHLAAPFRGKTVVIAYDRGRTEPGVAAAREIAQVLLEEGAASVRILEWPDEALAACGGEKIDANAYFMQAGGTREGFQALIDAAVVFEPTKEASSSNAATSAPTTSSVPSEAPSSPGGGGDPAAAANGGGVPPERPAGAIGNALWRYYFRVTKTGITVKVTSTST